MINYELQDDCLVLLNRALLNKTVCAFGADGHGEHGYSLFPQYFNVSDITVLINSSQAELNPVAIVMLSLDDFDSDLSGHVSTDNNLRISINTHLISEEIDPKCWAFAPFSFQGTGYVVLEIEVNKLDL